VTADRLTEPEQTEPGPTVLEAADVSVELGGLPVLRGVSMAVHAGETVALLGGNGSGKSTLVRSLVGLLPHQRGMITLFGRPLRLFRNWQWIGYVPQRTPVGTSAATVREVVAAGRLARRIPFLPAGRQQRLEVTEALETVGMADRVRDPISWLSGGQQQRVLIARALVAKPRLLILDEPIAGVDLEHQRVLASVLDRLTANGTAILVVLHEVGPLAGQIDRAVVLSEGRVAYQGSLGGIPGLRAGGHECDEPAIEPGLIGPSMIETRGDLVRRNGTS
jgi:zinc transport system ATP-binding protein